MQTIKPPQMIGIRKMSVIMFCVTAIVTVVWLYLHYNKTIDVNAMAVIAAIAGLGGWHMVKQAEVDKQKEVV